MCPGFISQVLSLGIISIIFMLYFNISVGFGETYFVFYVDHSFL